MVKFTLWIIFASLFLCGCLTSTIKPTVLTLERLSKPSPNFKINGYYHQSSNLYACNGTCFDVYYFYQNGIFYRSTKGLDQNTSKSLPELDDYFRHRDSSKNEIKFRNTYADSWGIYRVDSSVLTLQSWYVEGSYITFTQKGDIINDSTVVLKDFYLNSRWPNTKIYSYSMKFREFSPKPDSTNRFIK